MLIKFDDIGNINETVKMTEAYKLHSKIIFEGENDTVTHDPGVRTYLQNLDVAKDLALLGCPAPILCAISL